MGQYHDNNNNNNNNNNYPLTGNNNINNNIGRQRSEVPNIAQQGEDQGNQRRDHAQHGR